MSRQQWAAIVYGRSYHLDFRFITIPHNFTEKDLTWALQHILSTTHQARHLCDHPRWSLFKNNLYCVVGVTCMVRDLISEVKAKDDQGRPLYVFLGYATPLQSEQTLLDIPPYTGNQLANFEPLYQQVEKVWLVKDYQANSKNPSKSQYQAVTSFIKLNQDLQNNYTCQLNHQDKHPDKTYLWSNTHKQNNQLWLASAQCSQATSICLNIKDKSLPASPFLNQTVSQLEQFTIRQRIPTSNKALDQLPKSSLSLSQKISTRAQEDINVTLQQAAKVTAASQELINNLSNWSHQPDHKHPHTHPSELESFGFKTKNTATNQTEEDWF
ncbi:hypothetical protein NIES4102_08580 [Chondrocystis sp. NIES-4102]|nr:hypothetical protein NIES4102_08580 [Chondrocystis sp. NIES-4102]